jgi:sec-independent protein translocase protein TatA
MFGSFGWMELLLILFIVLIIFGAGKIPQLGEGLGKAIKGFKKSVHEPDAVDVTSAPAQDQPPQGAPAQLAQSGSSPSAQPAGQSQAGQAGQPGPVTAPPQPEQPRQG